MLCCDSKVIFYHFICRTLFSNGNLNKGHFSLFIFGGGGGGGVERLFYLAGVVKEFGEL